MRRSNLLAGVCCVLSVLSVAAIPSAMAQSAPAKTAVDTSKIVGMEVFGVKPFMFQPRMSPDGKLMAVRLNHKQSDYLSIIDLENPKTPPRFVISSGELRDLGDRTFGGYRWVGNDTLVITLASREAIGSDRGDITRLTAYNLTTGKSTPLAWDQAGFSAGNILWIDHENGKLLLERDSTAYSYEMLGRPEVVEVDVKTGRYVVVRKPNVEVGGWYADSKGVVRAGGGYDRDNGEQRILYRSKDGEAFKTVTRSVDKDFTGSGIQPQLIMAEGDKAIATSNHEGHTKVYEVDLKTMELGKALFESKGYDADGAIPSFDRGSVIGFSVTEERAKSVFTAEPFKTVVEVFEEKFGKGNVDIASYNRDATRFILSIGKTNQAGAYFLYDTVTGNVRQIGWVRDSIKGAEMNPVSTITYTASDGEKIPAVLTMPRHRAGGRNLPLVVMPHGGPFGVRDSEEFGYFPWAQAIAELGYVVIQPNYRGSGGYGAEWVKKGRSEGFGIRMQDDLNDAITHLAGQGIVDPARVCMMGWSYGGYASARAAQRDGDKYRCTIAGAGVYDLALMRRYDRRYLGSFGMNYLSKGEADLATVSPAKNPDGKWAPILIVHGYRDSRVPIEQARVLVSALKGAGKVEGRDYRYVEQKENTHNFPYDADHIEWLKETADWLAKHNPAYLPGEAAPVSGGK